MTPEQTKEIRRIIFLSVNPVSLLTLIRDAFPDEMQRLSNNPLTLFNLRYTFSRSMFHPLTDEEVDEVYLQLAALTLGGFDQTIFVDLMNMRPIEGSGFPISPHIHQLIRSAKEMADKTDEQT